MREMPTTGDMVTRCGKMTTTTSITGSLCPKCYKFGVRIIGRVDVSKNTFKHVKMCQYCGTRYEE